MSAPLWDGGGGYWYDIMSVMGADAAEGYMAELLDPQRSKFDLKGGGATTAMKESRREISKGVGKRTPGG
jgi:hypothetical protein